MYSYESISETDKRTDYPGKDIAAKVQIIWDKDFNKEIEFVTGNEWKAGNLSYHLSSRPMWMHSLKNKVSTIGSDEGVVYVGNPKILKEVCPGVFGKIRPVGYCMIGQK